MEDLFQIGAIGLTKAAEKYEKDLGYAFSTYAVPLIIGEIRRFLRDDGMIHICRQAKDYARKIAIAKQEWEKTYGTEPTIDKLAELTGLTQEDILQGLEANVTVESIYTPLAGQANSDSAMSNMLDTLVDERENDSNLLDMIALNQALDKLNSEEKMVILLRYKRGMTQSEVAKCIGKNQVAVSRLEKKILLQLREDFIYNESDSRKSF